MKWAMLSIRITPTKPNPMFIRNINLCCRSGINSERSPAYDYLLDKTKDKTEKAYLLIII